MKSSDLYQWVKELRMLEILLKEVKKKGIIKDYDKSLYDIINNDY